jgi:hypothetical protein
MESRRAKLIHDLRNQLNNITMNAELAKLELAVPIEKDSDRGSKRAALESIDVILCACKFSAAIVHDLSTLSADSN